MSLRVIDPGPLTTVQDAGRPGWAHLGVPRAGFVDAASATLAHRLVGNPEHAALLETTLGGVRFVLEVARTLAVTGARCDVTADGRAIPLDHAVTLPAGTEVVVGAARRGLRSYVAPAGGIVAEPVLGSRSTDTLAGIGPPALRAGTVLPLGAPGAPAATDVAAPSWPAAVLRLRPGPQADWLLRPRELDGAVARVGAASNRVGVRLEGVRVERRAGELPSEGMVLGAVQAPGGGELVVFLNDHPPTGGYPVIGVVDPRDLAWCAQARPGDEVRLRLV
ncbi:biotin-dependent carboxyltransferase family protein [Nocardioides daphniae]|uniref:Allophanate hydrolase n=1 Tax=Nocardioides daphniae TaxID=402297 RepID=A0A4P7UCM6_9ACTN|nr:biotin-dependent carboxyltransferase family protein [Nocardioides daphniae]QCC77068.1 biotin-dependent carboxyltransferase [Nocardioides daphniae]GGD19283.1 allophanate hydrolase [Nocardioides daphniae]